MNPKAECILRLVALVISLWMAPHKASCEWSNSLKPEGVASQPFVFVHDRNPVARICISTSSSLTETSAAEELRYWVAEITSASLQIVKSEPASGDIALSHDPALGNEGYRIDVQKGILHLFGGKTRGVVNAVYALLEEDMGCRFYTREFSRLQQTGTLEVRAVPRQYIPKLAIRDPYYHAAFDPVWSRRNRTNAPSAPVPQELGGHVDYANMFVHTAAQILPPEKYAREHPEYYAQRADGTTDTSALCATNADVATIATAYVREVLKEHPDTEIVSVSKNDVQNVCHCSRCTELRTSEGSDMANQLVLVNSIAETLEKEYPDLLIDTLAYLDTIQIPKTIRPRKNVVIRLCNDNVGAWSHPFTPAEKCDVAKLVSAWSAVHDRISIWDYNVNFSHYLAPMPNIDIMASNIRFWLKNNAVGVMLQGDYQGPSEQDELKCWVTAKLLWNPNWDEKKLTMDFIEGYYGTAAPAIMEYQSLVEDLRLTYPAEMATLPDGIRYPMDSPFLTTDFITTSTAIFIKARKQAAKNADLVRRVERAELPILYVQCVRGPGFVGEEYGKVVKRFERIARREGVHHLAEGDLDFEPKLAEWKKRIP